MEFVINTSFFTRSFLVSVIIALILYPNAGTSQIEDQLYTTGSTILYNVQKNETEIQEIWNASEEYATVFPSYVSSASTVGQIGRSWSVERYPNPLIQPHECGMKKRQFVCDPDHVLEDLEVARIMNITLSIRFNIDYCACKTDCPKGMKGYAFSVAVVKQIKYKNRIPQTTKEKSMAIQYFGDYLRAKKWKFGYCGNDGVVVLVTDDKMIYSSLGWWTIVRIIPPQICIANATAAADKYVQQGKYGQAIITILEHYHKYLRHGNCEEDILRPEEDAGNYSDPVVWILIGCIVIVFVLLLILVIVFKPKKDDSETTALRTSFDEGHSNEAFSQTLDIYPDDRA